jgi:hypothetical protein
VRIRTIRPSSVALVGLIVVSLVAGPAAAAEPRVGESRRVTLRALFFAQGPDGAFGGFSPFTVRYTRTKGKDFRVGFSEDEVAGTGDQWRAAGWNAATVATLLLGAPLKGVRVDFDITGRIDGPSAGALMTVGLLALIRGDKIRKDITMTGTINPDGTVGPVGGIPFKVDGARKAKAKRMLIPVGQRNAPISDDETVDVFEVGRRRGVRVAEVADICEVYKAFTGKTLPRPKAPGKVALSDRAYRDIRSRVQERLAEFRSTASEYTGLDPAVQELVGGVAGQAAEAAERAEDLSEQGLQAGAYTEALLAQAFITAALKAGRSVQVLFTEGFDPFVAQIRASAAIDQKVEALAGRLKNFRPKTVSDAATLINAYGNAVDAISVANYGSNLLDQASNASSEEELITSAVLGAVFYELAGTVVEGTKDIYEVGRGLGGAKLRKDIDMKAGAAFFRKAAEANLAAFDALIIEPQAEQAGLSSSAAQQRFASVDFDYALTQSSLGVLQGALDDYFGDAKTASYAKLGAAVSLYTRSAGLLSKYYSLAELDENLEVVGISNERALTAALDLGESQVRRGVGVLRAKKVAPTLVVAAYESAGVDREGDASDKLDALGEYLNAYVASRVLAYLGGFQTAGLR